MPKKKSRINEKKYILTALTYLVRVPLAIGGILTTLAGIYLRNESIIYIGVALLAVACLSFIISFSNSHSVTCRLCRAQFFKSLRCSKKKNVPSILGNVRLPLALAVITRRPSIRCPYCGEKHVYFGTGKR